MIPSNIGSYNFTESELLIYNLLKDKLQKDYKVFYSVSYHIPSNRGKFFYRGEVDFVILLKDYGFISMEVKGGKGLIYKDKSWELILNEPQIPDSIEIPAFTNDLINLIKDSKDKDIVFESYQKDLNCNLYCLKDDADEDSLMSIFSKYHLLTERRKLRVSPITQASNSTDVLKKYFREITHRDFSGRAGYCVCFPNFRLDENLGIELADRNLIIDSFDLDKIKQKIDKVFDTFNPDKMMNTEDYIVINDIINKNRFYGITTAQEIKLSKKRLDEINRVQDFALNLLKNYNKIKFRGGAGTGKTWVAMKKAILCAKSGMKTLLTCFNSDLSTFMSKICEELIEKEIMPPEKKAKMKELLEVRTFNSLMLKIIGKRYYEAYRTTSEKSDLPNIDHEIKAFLCNEIKYNAIIVDEAQDFSAEWQDVLEELLLNKDKGILYFFYDPYQNIYKKSHKNLLIAEPEYVLTENLRNTKEIYDYAIDIANSSILQHIDDETFNNEILCYTTDDEKELLLSSYKKEDGYFTLKNNIENNTKEQIWRLFDKIGYKTIEPSNLDGIKPNTVTAKTEREAAKLLKDTLTRLIKENGCKPEQIVILSNRRLEKSFINNYQYMLDKPLAYEESNDIPNSIRFRTIQSFKGLESDVVIYLEHYSKNEEHREYDNNPYLKYVAYTRAKFVLEIIKYDDLENLNN